jgi:hypothetical protein
MKTLTILIFGMVCVSIASTAQGRSNPTSKPTSITPITDFPAKWGNYTVVSTADRFEDERYQIFDRTGKCVQEIDCADDFGLYTAPLSNGPIRDLVIDDAHGISNMLCLHATYVFSQDHGIHNIAAVCGGDGEFEFSRRYDWEYVMPSSSVLEWACDVCHACSPQLPLILSWNNGRPVDVTRLQPSLSIAAAQHYKKTFEDIRNSWTSAEPEEDLIASAAGYYGNEYEIGNGPQAYREIMRRLPNQDSKMWFRSCAFNVHCKIREMRHMTTVSTIVLIMP